MYTVMLGLRKIVLLCLTTKFFVGAALEVTLVHTNDIHTRFEETDENGNVCTEELMDANRCYGGVARRATAIQNFRENDPNVLLLDAGDQFQGPTLWFYVYKGMATAHFMELLEYNVMALGNHEFDNGIEDIVRFMRNVTFPVISCNIDSTEEPDMSGLYACSSIVTIENKDIAIVGYTTVTTVDYAKPGNLVFQDEVSVLQEEVTRLQEQGINKIIALGHSGIDTDLEIARQVPGVDIVVGGHSNTFLYNGEPPTSHSPFGDYPLLVTPDDDPTRSVLVVHAYAYGVYLGHLSVTFDDDGEVESYDGNPVLLDSSFSKDPIVLAEMQSWNEKVQNVASSVVGLSLVELVGDYPVCGTRECNLGNMLTDAMVFTYFDTSGDPSGWSPVTLAIHTAGSIRSSLVAGEIPIGQLNQIMPYGNTIDLVELEGRYLLEVLETAIAGVNEGEPSGSFPQMSGIRVEYDLMAPPMERVLRVHVLCSACDVPQYEPLEENTIYKVAMNSYMAGGGGGFQVIRENRLSKVSGILDLDVTIAYIAANSPIRTGIENRIIVYDSATRPGNSGAMTKHLGKWILLFVVVSLCSPILTF